MENKTMSIREVFTTNKVEVIDLMPPYYIEIKDTIINKIRFKSILDIAGIAVIKREIYLYIIKYRGVKNINVEHVTKILNDKYKVIKNSEMNKFDSWIDFQNATAGVYKTRDNILIDLDN